MRNGIVLAIVGIVLTTAVANAAVDFTEADQFWYGMGYQEAVEELEGRHWNVLGEVSTPSTSEIRCIWREELFYILRFYKGRLYHMEKRAEQEPEGVGEAFTYYLTNIPINEDRGEYLDAMPTPDGGIQPVHNDDNSLIYCRWHLEDREVEVTAQANDDGLYMMYYEEFDPELRTEAEHVRQAELQAGPQVIDPLTGRPRQTTEPGQGGENQENNNDDEDEQEPPPDDDEEDDWWG